MLMQTNVVFMGCRIWIDGESKRDLERAQARLERWILEFIGNPPKFTTVGKKSGTTKRATKSCQPKPVTTGTVPQGFIQRTEPKDNLV